MSKYAPSRLPIEERLVRDSAPTEYGCLIWTRALNNRGYGVTYYDGKLRLAHRVSWYLRNGRWPADGLVLDHTCEVKQCINPDHLVETTNTHNVTRAYASPMNAQLRRTACGRGHDYTEETLRFDSKGHRQCRVCDEIRGRSK
jgi:hypothetical protein